MTGRTARVLAIVVVSVVALLVLLDRVGLYVAQRIAADTIKTSQHLSSRPDVDIAGFPFLNQLATGKYDKVTVTADDVPVGLAARPLVVDHVRVVLHTLTVSRNFQSMHAKRADATASIGYDELGRVIGARLGYAGDGRIRATKTITARGASTQASITARPRLSGGALSFSDVRVQNAGALGGAAAAAGNRLFDAAIPLRGARFGVRVRAVQVSDDGMTIVLSGRNLAYTR
jgi:hypothetical protein